jgi:hypothetical protein
MATDAKNPHGYCPDHGTGALVLPDQRGAGQRQLGAVQADADLASTLQGMAGADQPMPTPGSADVSPSVAGSDGPAQPPAHRSWVGSLLCVPFLAVLTLFAVQAAQLHQWGRLTGFICVLLIFLSVPAGELKWRRHVATGSNHPNLPPAASESSAEGIQTGLPDGRVLDLPDQGFQGEV